MFCSLLTFLWILIWNPEVFIKIKISRHNSDYQLIDWAKLSNINDKSLGKAHIIRLKLHILKIETSKTNFLNEKLIIVVEKTVCKQIKLFILSKKYLQLTNNEENPVFVQEKLIYKKTGYHKLQICKIDRKCAVYCRFKWPNK